MEERMEDRLLREAAALHAAWADLSETLAAFAATDQWQGAGIRSIGHWCDVQLGIASQAAGELVGIATRLVELPELRRAFAEGALSLDKVRLVAPIATAATDVRFTAIAREASVAQLRRICGAYRRLGTDESTAACERRRQRRRVAVGEVEDGLVRIVAVLEPDEAAIVVAALDARVEQAWRHDPRPTDLADRRADALVELATEKHAAGPDPIVRGERVEVRVHVDAALLSGSRPDGRCEIEGLGPVPKAMVERLLCDCRFRLTADGRFGTLDLGRAQRTVSGRQRRALQHRDRGCRYPGCGARRFVDAHHVVPWEEGGRTDIDNLLLLCPAHHRLFHDGGYTIDAPGDGSFTFRRPDGRSLHPPPLRSSPAGRPAAAGVPSAGGGGERFDLALTIDALTTAT